MTTPSTESASVPAAKPASLWEDFIDFFYAPSTVFDRRRDANPWPMILIVTALMVLLSVLTFNSIVGLVEPMIRKGMEKAAAANPRFTQDMLEGQLRTSLKLLPWGPLVTPIFMLVGALVVWLVGKLFGSKASYTQSLLIIAYVGITFVVGYLVVGIQALVLNTANMTNVTQLSLSPARFVNPTGQSPWLFGILMALDLLTLWRIALVAIGLRVIGKTTKGQAIGFAVVAFLIMALWSVRTAMQMVA